MGEGHFEEALREMDVALARMRRISKAVGDSSSDDGWAKSERSRLSKALGSLRVRQKALQTAKASSDTTTPSPPTTRDGLDEVVEAGGGRKRPRSGEVRRANIGGGGRGSLGRTPSPPRLVSLPAERFEAVDERIASALSYEEFIETYALKGRPVVLKGGVKLCFEGGRGWDREALRREAGDKVVPVRRWVPDSVSWARLEDAGQIPLGQLLGPPPPSPPRPPPLASSTGATANGNGGVADNDAANGESRGGNDDQDLEVVADKSTAGKFSGGRHPGVGRQREPLYLHDWSLPQNLGAGSSLLADRFQVPKFFAGDMLQRLAGQGLPYTDSWPSLFVGPKGSKSDTHIDSFGSHFWMALLEGKKRWVLYPKEDAPLLYPVWPEGCHDPIFEADLDNPDVVRTPAVLQAKGSSCVLEAGDLLFVPAGCPHRVENLTNTLALSCNYVDATNVDGSLKALRDQALTEPSAGALASALGACDRRLVREQSQVPWARLKKWPRSGEVADWVAPAGTCGMPPAS
eukprot:g7456.t1